MASKGTSGGGGVGKATLIPIALLSALLLLQALGMLPTTVTDEITRWAATGLFVFGAVALGSAGSAVWCGLCAAMDKEFAALEPHWLHTEDGADCVCVIHAARLAKWRG